MNFRGSIAVLTASIWLIPMLTGCDSGEPTEQPSTEVTPFTNVARSVLEDDFMLWNDRPGVAVFDYDRDGDHDVLITSDAGHANFLHRNEGDGTFVNVASDAGISSAQTNSSGVAACDINNDGFQDVYIGALGVDGDGLDFRSALGANREALELREAISDRLFLNDGDGSFTDITEDAFGESANLRSAASVVCADIDGDGWLDIYVCNMGDPDFRTFATASHPGHYNVLYRNRADTTFEDVSEIAGVRGPQILMRDHEGRPIVFEDAETGEKYEGYDPNAKDRWGNQMGEPTGQTHSAVFFDHDDDRDPDLWVGDDGNRLHVYRNDSTPGSIRFTPLAQQMGIDQVGSWMGFTVGDYDNDSDLDVFVTNMGYHLLMRPPRSEPSGSCEYHVQFEWSHCLLRLLRNDGPTSHPEAGLVGAFTDVSASTRVAPSRVMPPDSLDPTQVHTFFDSPQGLEAYDFGFGTTFFDYDNDGDQDLYWLGSTLGRGDGPGGQVFPSAGRMLSGDGRGSFEDITIQARLLDILGVDYSERSPDDPRNSPEARKMDPKFHENGKGLAHGDLNGDGYVDLIGTNSSGPIWSGSLETMSRMKGPVFIWLNGGGQNSWIILRLKGRMAIDGTGSNADGIGARVYVKTTHESESEPLVQVQEVRAGSSYLSMDSVELEFGLDTATVVDEINVLWPSGREQTLENIPAGQFLVITEPAGSS